MLLLTLLYTLCQVYAASKQIQFEQALHSYQPQEMRELLKEYDPSELDPSVGNSEALEVSCKSQDTELTKMLLQDPRIDPSASNYRAAKMAVRDLLPDMVLVYLHDGRIPVELVYDVPFHMRLINPTYYSGLLSIPEHILTAVVEGTLTSDMLSEPLTEHILQAGSQGAMALNTVSELLSISQIETLLKLSKDNADQRRPLLRLQLIKLGAPSSIYDNSEILYHLSKQNICTASEIKAHFRLRSNLATALPKLESGILSRITAEAENEPTPLALTPVQISPMPRMLYQAIALHSMLRFQNYSEGLIPGFAIAALWASLLIEFMTSFLPQNHAYYPPKDYESAYSGMETILTLIVLFATVLSLLPSQYHLI